MALTPEEQEELNALESKFSGVGRVTPRQRMSELASTVSRGRQVQSLPRTLAFGPQFKRADTSQDTGLASNMEEAGGRITDLTGSPALGTLTRMSPDIALSAIPGEAFASAAGPASRWLAEHLMFKALKPSAAGEATVAQAEQQVKTMLEGGYNVTEEGLKKMYSRVGNLENEIRDLVSKSKERMTLADLSPSQVSTKGEFAFQKDQKAVDRVYDEIKRRYFPKGDISVQDAHALKQKIYKNMRESDFRGEITSGEVAGRKGVTGALRESTLKVPGVQEKLAEQSKLMDVLEPMEKRLIVDLRNNPASLSLLAHNPVAFAAMLADRSGPFKSIVANMLNQRGQGMARIAGQVLGTTGVGLNEISNAGQSTQPF